MDNLLAAHAFDNIVLRNNSGLTSCKDVAMVVDNSLGNKIINLCFYCSHAYYRIAILIQSVLLKVNKLGIKLYKLVS